jgi:alpha-tubulin suppressor-like RCC1 family protein
VIFQNFSIQFVNTNNEDVFNIIGRKLNFMLAFTKQLLDSEPKNRISANEILSHNENWCISCNDIIVHNSVSRILNRWTPYKHVKTKTLHENLIHGFFKEILYRDYYASETFRKSFSEHYPQFETLNPDFKTNIESVYVYREMMDKLFFITKYDEVYEITVSDHIDDTINSPVKLTVLCNIGVRGVTCGERHVIAITKSGLLYSWGDNCCGQLGDGTNINRDSPRKIESLMNLNIIEVSCGAYHSLALTHDGKIFSWGYNKIGQIGIGQNKNNEWVPVEVKFMFPIHFVMISCGYHHSVALSSDGKVYSWGYNEYGQLGLGHNFNREIPSQINRLNNIPISKIVCGRYHSLFLAFNGQVYGCGKNSSGQLGNDTECNMNFPIVINGFEEFQDVSASTFDNITFAKSKFNEFYVCGETYEGDIPSLIKTKYRSFHEMRMSLSISRRMSQPLFNIEVQDLYADRFSLLGSSLLKTISPQVYLATNHSYMVTKSLIINNTNEVYYLNLMTDTNIAATPKKDGEFSKSSIISIVSGATHMLALTETGKIYSWGYNNKGQLGYLSSPGFYRPKLINLIDKFVKVSCGAYHSLALSASGDVYSWGHNYRGELGNNSTSDELTPYRIMKLRCLRIVDIACGYNHSIAVSENGKCYGWGNNEFGQLGIGNNSNIIEPVQVIFPIDARIIKVTCGTNHTLFLSSNGRIFACGLNNFGQIGNATEENQNKPVELSCSVTFIDFHATIFDHISVARSEDGECYMWGDCGGEGKLIPEKTNCRSMNEIFALYSKSKYAYKMIPIKFVL